MFHGYPMLLGSAIGCLCGLFGLHRLLPVLLSDIADALPWARPTSAAGIGHQVFMAILGLSSFSTILGIATFCFLGALDDL